MALLDRHEQHLACLSDRMTSNAIDKNSSKPVKIQGTHCSSWLLEWAHENSKGKERKNASDQLQPRQADHDGDGSRSRVRSLSSISSSWLLTCDLHDMFSTYWSWPSLSQRPLLYCIFAVHIYCRLYTNTFVLWRAEQAVYAEELQESKQNSSVLIGRKTKNPLVFDD